MDYWQGEKLPLTLGADSHPLRDQLRALYDETDYARRPYSVEDKARAYDRLLEIVQCEVMYMLRCWEGHEEAQAQRECPCNHTQWQEDCSLYCGEWPLG